MNDLRQLSYLKKKIETDTVWIVSYKIALYQNPNFSISIIKRTADCIRGQLPPAEAGGLHLGR